MLLNLTACQISSFGVFLIFRVNQLCSNLNMPWCVLLSTVGDTVLRYGKYFVTMLPNHQPLFLRQKNIWLKFAVMPRFLDSFCLLSLGYQTRKCWYATVPVRARAVMPALRERAMLLCHGSRARQVWCPKIPRTKIADVPFSRDSDDVHILMVSIFFFKIQTWLFYL